MMELTKADLTQLAKMFEVLEQCAEGTELTQIEIHCVYEGQAWVIGYGESGEPALLSVSEVE